MRRFISSVRMGAATTVELVRGVANGPYWWLAPVIAMLLPLAVVFILLQTVPMVAPFVYTLP